MFKLYITLLALLATLAPQAAYIAGDVFIATDTSGTNAVPTNTFNITSTNASLAGTLRADSGVFTNSLTVNGSQLGIDLSGRLRIGPLEDAGYDFSLSRLEDDGFTATKAYSFFQETAGGVYSAWTDLSASGAQWQLDFDADDSIYAAAGNGYSLLYLTIAGSQVVRFNPAYPDTFTPFLLNATVAHTSGNLFEVSEAGTIRFAVDHAGSVRVTSNTPANASATGVAGTITWDADYIYVCTAANTWKRVAISTWP